MSPARPAAARDDRDQDDWILGLLRSRDPEGCRQLLVVHGGVVLERLRRAFGRWLSPDDLEDALASALVRAHEATALRGHLTGTLRAWFWIVTRNCALSLVRGRRRAEIPLDQVAHILADLTPIPAEQDRLRRIADLQASLALLGPLQRRVIQADLDADGKANTRRLGERLGVTADAIQQARSRAHRRLRTIMLRLGHGLDARGWTTTLAEGLG
ncbi:MAG: sigma-70 family RNA polymerase sigma factor [Planctomycetes bacterium]|nr:sigma-70 family RNA polymerase sigma factor [Planctomycetota bacterium]